MATYPSRLGETRKFFRSVQSGQSDQQDVFPLRLTVAWQMMGMFVVKADLD